MLSIAVDDMFVCCFVFCSVSLASLPRLQLVLGGTTTLHLCTGYPSARDSSTSCVCSSTAVSVVLLRPTRRQPLALSLMSQLVVVDCIPLPQPNWSFQRPSATVLLFRRRRTSNLEQPSCGRPLLCWPSFVKMRAEDSSLQTFFLRWLTFDTFNLHLSDYVQTLSPRLEHGTVCLTRCTDCNAS